MYGSTAKNVLGFRLTCDIVALICLVFGLIYFFVGDGIEAFQTTIRNFKQSVDDDNFEKPGSMFIPMHSYAQTSKDANYGEDEKSRRKFTLDQDKVILDKIIDILPGHRLDYLELVAASSPCKEVANKLSRTESSIQGRWKYSLRTWLLEYFKKKTKSWTGFTVKASIERRTAVANYFVKEIKRRGIKMNGFTAQVKQSH